MRKRSLDFVRDVEILGGVSATVASVSQTSNRAAVLALEFIADRFYGKTEIVPDSLNLVSGSNQKRRHLVPQGANADVWHSVGQKLKLTQPHVSIRKTTSHLEQKRADFHIAMDIVERDYLGNAAADAYADRGSSIPLICSCTVTGCGGAHAAEPFNYIPRDEALAPLLAT